LSSISYHGIHRRARHVAIRGCYPESFLSRRAPFLARRNTVNSGAIARSGGSIAFALRLACRVALIRYRRVSRNSAALIFPSIKHFLLQPFPLDLIRHRCISLSPPIVMILSRSTLLVILDATFSSRQEITPASYRARTNHTIR
jgi:hypothetical protein